MLEFFSLKKETFGLDISDLSLKIVKLKKKKKNILLESFGEFEIEPGIIEGGEIKNEERLAKIIKNCLNKVEGKKIKTKYVVSSLPEEKSFLQVISFPPMTEEEVKSAIVFEAENYIPLPINEVYFDFQILSSPWAEKLEVLFAGFPKKIADSYLRTLKKANLEPVAFEIESQAIARALIKEEKTDFPVLIVDFGATRTSFVIFAQQTVMFTCSLPISGNLFTEIISKNLRISFEEAEKLKRKYGIGKKFKIEEVPYKKEEKNLFEILLPSLVDFKDQLKRYIDFWETHEGIKYFQSQKVKIKEIILCGGGANLKGLSNFLNLEFQIPVKLGSPWVNISEKAILPLEKSLSLTCAIGLALRPI